MWQRAHNLVSSSTGDDDVEEKKAFYHPNLIIGGETLR